MFTSPQKLPLRTFTLIVVGVDIFVLLLGGIDGKFLAFREDSGVNWEAVSAVATAIASCVTAAATLIAFRALRLNEETLKPLRQQVDLAVAAENRAKEQAALADRPHGFIHTEENGHVRSFYLTNSSIFPISLIGSFAYAQELSGSKGYFEDKDESRILLNRKQTDLVRPHTMVKIFDIPHEVGSETVEFLVYQIFFTYLKPIPSSHEIEFRIVFNFHHHLDGKDSRINSDGTLIF